MPKGFCGVILTQSPRETVGYRTLRTVVEKGSGSEVIGLSGALLLEIEALGHDKHGGADTVAIYYPVQQISEKSKAAEPQIGPSCALAATVQALRRHIPSGRTMQ